MRYTLRTLLLAVVIIALACGWCVDHRRLRERMSIYEGCLTWNDVLFRYYDNGNASPYMPKENRLQYIIKSVGVEEFKRQLATTEK